MKQRRHINLPAILGAAAVAAVVLPQAASAAGPAYEAAVLADNPVAYWEFDEAAGTTTAADTAGSFDGTYTGNLTLESASADPRLGTAALLSGGYIDVPAVGTYAQASIEAWINISGLAGGCCTSIFSTDGFGGGNLHFNIKSGRDVEHAIAGGNPNNVNTPGGLIQNGTWYHIVATYDTTQGGETKIYVNGVEQVASAHASGISTNLGAAEIGAWNGGRNLPGLIDEVAIYDTILSPERVQAHYDAAFTPLSDPFLEVAAGVDLDRTSLSQGAVVRSVDVGNGGATMDLNVTGASFVGGDAALFSTLVLPAGPLAPGASAEVGFTFTPTALGTFTTTLSIASDDVNSPHDVELTIVVAEDPFLAAPGSVSAPTIQLPGATTATVSIPIDNTGVAEDLVVTAVDLSGPDAALFTNPILPGPIPPGGSGVIELTFTPLMAGSFTATAEIASNSQNSSPTSVTIDASVLQTSLLPGGLVAYWSFDEDASELTGNHDGTLIGGAAITSGGLGFDGGEALQLSAEGDYVDVANPTTFDFNASFTWHARIKTTDNSGAILSRNPDGTAWNQGSKALFVRNRGGNGEAEWDSGWVANPRTLTVVNDDAWHTIIATYDADTDLLNVFVDPSVGATSGQFSGVHNANSFDEHTHLHNGGIADTSFTIGRADFSGGLASLDTLIGLFDDVAIFDQVLTGADLDTLIESGPAGFLPTAPDDPNFVVSTDGTDLVFTWDSKLGEIFNILSDDDMVPNDPAEWAEFQSGIAATPPQNTLVVPYPTDPQQFFALENLGPEPLFSDDFEADTGWTAGVDGDNGTVWERGVPSVVGPLTAFSGENCFGTNLASTYTANADSWLRSPAIDLTDAALTGARLTLQQFKDIEPDFHWGIIRVLDAATGLQLGPDVANPVDGTSTDWGTYSVNLPAEALGNTIRIEFRLVSDATAGAFAGWYLDDVEVFPN